MRVIHADLITAQKTSPYDPYIYLSINGTDYSSRLISLEHTEEPYRDRATIILKNSDRHFNATANDLRGKSFNIGYGYVTGSGNRYCGDGAGSEAMPTLWVKSQSMVSAEGTLVCILECEGGWMMLREHTFIATVEGASAPYFNVPYAATDTVYEIIEKVLEEIGFVLSAESVDEIISTFHPIFTANPFSYESAAAIIYRLILMSKCFMREVQGEAFEIVYPQDDDAVQETYYNNQVPYFKEYTEKLNLLVPNSIVVFCNNPTGGDWDTETYPLIIGTASDAASIADYGEVIEYHIAPYITSSDAANLRADAILTRYKFETLAGRLVLPIGSHDCRVELYDRVKIVDIRGV